MELTDLYIDPRSLAFYEIITARNPMSFPAIGECNTPNVGNRYRKMKMRVQWASRDFLLGLKHVC
jgi:hypothetical protein